MGLAVLLAYMINIYYPNRLTQIEEVPCKATATMRPSCIIYTVKRLRREMAIEKTHKRKENMWNVEITSKEVIKPSSPTPPHLRIHKLSWIDKTIAIDHIPFILFYPNPNPNPNSFSALKNSLSQALSLFYPFAGELDPDRAFVDCSDQGAHIIEAVAISDTPLSRLIDLHPAQNTLNTLLPCDNGSCRKKSGNPLVSIQLTTFSSCGGMAIGACLSHRIADGHSAAAFVAAWAGAAAAGPCGDDVTGMPRSLFDAASLFTPPPPEKCCIAAANVPLSKLVTKRFHFKESTISNLRVSSSSSVADLTRVEAVIATMWRCCTRARGAERRWKSSIASIAVNVRGKAMPPLPGNLFGNLVYKAAAAMAESEMGNGEGAKAKFEEKVRNGIKKVDGERLRRYQGADGLSLQLETMSGARDECDGDGFDMYWFTSWTRFGFYEADFGWGKPAWVGIGGNLTAKNLVILMGRGGGGGIEAWVTLEEEDMARFEKDEEITAYASPA